MTGEMTGSILNSESYLTGRWAVKKPRIHIYNEFVIFVMKEQQDECHLFFIKVNIA
jgi:hypothetical protein